MTDRTLDPMAVELSGTHLVEASAGTGKTYTITTLVLRLVVQRGLTIDEILVVTYTRAATAELKDRIRRRLREALGVYRGGGPSDQAVADGDPLALLYAWSASHDRVHGDEARILAAIRAFDEASVFTIHGFCQRALADNAFESGRPFEVDFEEDERALVDDLVHDAWVATFHGESEPFLSYAAKELGALDGLTALVRLVMGKPYLTWIPTTLDEDTYDTALAAFETARASVLARWEREGREAIERVRDAVADKRLHGGTYNKSRLAALEAVVGAWLTSDALPIELPREVELLTSSTMASKTSRKKVTPTHPLFDAFDELSGLHESLVAAMATRLVALRLSLARRILDALRRKKQELHVQFFDDLLVELYDALGGGMATAEGAALARAIRSRYEAALVDEFQDTDPVQLSIIDAIYHGAPGTALFLIGDPKQAIYSFRGADIWSYLSAAHRDGVERHTMATNYRSDPGVVQAIHALFDHDRVPRPFLVERERIEYLPVGTRSDKERLSTRSGLEILFVGASDQIPRGRDGRIKKGWANDELPTLVARDIRRFLADEPTIATNSTAAASSSIEGASSVVGASTIVDGSTVDADSSSTERRLPAGQSGDLMESTDSARELARRVTAGDIAVLVRTNRQADAVHEALTAAGLPAVMEGSKSVFDTDEAALVGLLFAVLASPDDGAVLEGVLASPLFELDAVAIAALGQDDDEWQRWRDRFAELSRVASREGVLVALSRLLGASDVLPRLLGRPGGERLVTNLRHLGELAHQAALQGHLGLEGVCRWLAEARQGDASARGGMQADQLRLERDTAAIHVVTMHKSKGLEYPVVYCPYLWDGGRRGQEGGKAVLYHDPEEGDRTTVDMGTQDLAAHQTLAEREAMAENLRLTYVALTRARHRAVVVWGPFSTAERSSLGYLLHHVGGATDGQPANETPADATAQVLATTETAIKAMDGPELLQATRAFAERASSQGDASVTVIDVDDDAAFSAPRMLLAEGEASSSPPPSIVAGEGAAPASREAPMGVDTGSEVEPSSFEASSLDPLPRRGGRVRVGVTAGPLSPLEAHVPQRRLDTSWRTGSFSSMTKSAHEALGEGPARDVDTNDEAPSMATSSGGHVPALLDRFPAGAAPGTAVHDVFESAFVGLDPEARTMDNLEVCAAKILDRHRFEGATWARPLARMVHDVLETSLSGTYGDVVLGRVPRGSLMAELEFLLPVAEGPERHPHPSPPPSTGEGIEQRGLSPYALAHVFGTFGEGHVRRYADFMKNLAPFSLGGFVKGFVDLVVEVDGRYHLLDYKTNHLGAEVDDYDRSAMIKQMHAHHYVLQYHLYLAALHRYLARRVPGYSYQTHMGDVFYLFVRGMAPNTGRGLGIYHDRPSEALVEALSALFDETEGGRHG